MTPEQNVKTRSSSLPRYACHMSSLLQSIAALGSMQGTVRILKDSLAWSSLCFSVWPLGCHKSLLHPEADDSFCEQFVQRAACGLGTGTL